MTAQDLYKVLLKEHVGPALRAEGLKGSAGTYRLVAADGNRALITFQKSQSNTVDDVSFTVNCAVYSAKLWAWQRSRDPWRPAEPGLGHPAALETRLGFLLPKPHDHWWTLRRGTDVAAIAQEVIAALRDRALPLLRAHLHDEQLIELYERSAAGENVRTFGVNAVARDINLCELLLATGGPRFAAAVERLEASLRTSPQFASSELRARFGLNG